MKLTRSKLIKIVKWTFAIALALISWHWFTNLFSRDMLFNKVVRPPSSNTLLNNQKKYVDNLAAKGEKPSIGEMFSMYVNSLNPFRRL